MYFLNDSEADLDFEIERRLSLPYVNSHGNFSLNKIRLDRPNGSSRNLNSSYWLKVGFEIFGPLGTIPKLVFDPTDEANFRSGFHPIGQYDSPSCYHF